MSTKPSEGAVKAADDYDALKSDLARVTAERDQLQSIAEKRYEEFRREANAHFVAAGEIEKLEARCGELAAALREIDEIVNDANHSAEDRLCAAANRLLNTRAESATPAKLCKHCGGAGVIHDTDIDGNITGYCDCPKCSATPAKHGGSAH